MTSYNLYCWSPGRPCGGGGDGGGGDGGGGDGGGGGSGGGGGGGCFENGGSKVVEVEWWREEKKGGEK